MKKLLKKWRNRAAVAAATVGMAATAKASNLPASFADDIAAVGTDITTVGGSLIGLAVIAVGIKWVKATFFG